MDKKQNLYEVTTKGYKRYFVLAGGYDEAEAKAEYVIREEALSRPVVNSEGDLNPFHTTGTVSLDLPQKIEKLDGRFIR